MLCPKCASDQSDVIDSRSTTQAVRRRRQCSACSYRFTTYERVERGRLTVVKKDGRLEPFVREKLLNGIDRACEKRDITRAQIDTLVDEIECSLFDEYELEVPSKVIGEKTMQYLSELDEVAYIRFASVYREFTDAESFATVVEMLGKDEEKEAV